MSGNDDILTTDEAMEYLKCARRSIYRWVKNDPQFPKPLHVGRDLRFRRSDLDAWMARDDWASDAWRDRRFNGQP